MVVRFVFSCLVSMFLVGFSFSGDFLDQMNQVLDGITTSQDALRVVDVQGRRYYIGGNLQYTIPNETIQPIQLSPPKLSAGCGGISVSLGSLSYLGFDQLVDKLQNALRQAPALAVQLVITNLCEKCGAILSFLEQVSDVVNGLNMDSCSLAKGGVGFLAKKTGLLTDKYSGSAGFKDANEWLRKVRNDIESAIPKGVKDFAEKIVNTYQNGANTYDCAVVTDPEQRARCFSELAGTFGDIKEGILHTALVESGAETSGFLRDVENILRAYVGDFIVKTADGTGLFHYISPKYDVTDVSSIKLDSSESLCFGRVDRTGSDLGKKCLDSLFDQKASELSAVYYKVVGGNSLSDSEKKLVSLVSIPIYAYFRDLARLSQIDPDAAEVISKGLIDKVARYIVISAFFDNFIRGANFLSQNIGMVKASVASGGSDISQLDPVISGMKQSVDNMLSNFRRQRLELDKMYAGDFDKFKAFAKQARKKVLLYLASYQYNPSYMFANRNW